MEAEAAADPLQGVLGDPICRGGPVAAGAAGRYDVKRNGQAGNLPSSELRVRISPLA